MRALLLQATSSGPSAAFIVVQVVGLVLLLGVGLFVGQFFNLWIQARLSEAPVSFANIIRMRLKGDDTHSIVLTHIRLCKAGAAVPLESLVQHHRAGGRLADCATVLVAGSGRGRAIPWDIVAEADLAGLDVLDLSAEALNASPAPANRTATQQRFVEAIAAAPPIQRAAGWA